MSSQPDSIEQQVRELAHELRRSVQREPASTTSTEQAITRLLKLIRQARDEGYRLGWKVGYSCGVKSPNIVKAQEIDAELNQKKGFSNGIEPDLYEHTYD